jgi:hypothetical protein
MNNTPTRIPSPINEPVLGFAPGSPERASLSQRLHELLQQTVEVPAFIGGAGRSGVAASLRRGVDLTNRDSLLDVQDDAGQGAGVHNSNRGGSAVDRHALRHGLFRQLHPSDSYGRSGPPTLNSPSFQMSSSLRGPIL